MANYAFDVFTDDWIRALLTGAVLVLFPQEDLLDPQRLYKIIIEEKINFPEFVPAVLQQIVPISL